MKTRYPVVISPTGEVKWAWLTNPCTRFVPDGLFSCDLLLGKDDAVKFISQIKPHLQAAIDELKALKKFPDDVNNHFPWHFDGDGRRVLFRFKQRAKIRTKKGETFDIIIPIYDAKNQPVIDNRPIFPGSKLRIQAEVVTWLVNSNLYLQLRIKSVQVAEYAPDDRNTCPFDEIETAAPVTETAMETVSPF